MEACRSRNQGMYIGHVSLWMQEKQQHFTAIWRANQRRQSSVPFKGELVGTGASTQHAASRPPRRRMDQPSDVRRWCHVPAKRLTSQWNWTYEPSSATSLASVGPLVNCRVDLQATLQGTGVDTPNNCRVQKQTTEAKRDLPRTLRQSPWRVVENMKPWYVGSSNLCIPLNYRPVSIIYHHIPWSHWCWESNKLLLAHSLASSASSKHCFNMASVRTPAERQLGISEPWTRSANAAGSDRKSCLAWKSGKVGAVEGHSGSSYGKMMRKRWENDGKMMGKENVQSMYADQLKPKMPEEVLEISQPLGWEQVEHCLQNTSDQTLDKKATMR